MWYTPSNRISLFINFTSKNQNFPLFRILYFNLSIINIIFNNENGLKMHSILFINKYKSIPKMRFTH